MNPYLTQALEMLRLNYLTDSISLLRQYASEKRASALLDAIGRISGNYSYLLKYLSSGSKDPGREAMFCDLRDELHALVRNAMIDEDSADSTTLYHSTLRSVKFAGMKFGDPLGRFISADASLQLTDMYDSASSLTADARRLLNEKDRALKDIFAVVWTLPLGDRTQLGQIVNVAADPDLSFELRAVITGALTLSLLEAYDPRKLTALLDIESRTADRRLRARALTGIVICLSRYAGDLPADPRLDSRFEAWCDDITNYPRLREVVYALVRTRGSERLMNRIQSDIIPGISQLGSGFIDSIKNSGGKINIEDIQENPEWEKLMHESGLDKKLRRLHRMHENGADMMLPMFSQLSGHFFFKDADTWLRPFESWEAVRMGLDGDLTSIFDSLPANTAMCDTDKYALMLNMSRIPAPARDMMKNAFMAGKEQMDEELKDLSLHSSHPEFDMEALNYARMLYRFFNYFRLHKEFYNPFAEGMDFTDLPYIGTLLAEDEILHNVGETYFHQGYYSDAAAVYSILLERHPSEASMLYQKIGYCQERDKKHREALDNYMAAARAVDFPDKDPWLMQHIYSMAVITGDHKARSYSLDQLLKADSDNTEYLLAWLRMSLDDDGLRNDGDRPELFEKRLAKYLYLSADSTAVLSLRCENEWRKCDYRNLLDLLAPRIADIEMYLAASSLGNRPDTTGHPAEDSEKAMASDMLMAVCAHAALEENEEAVSTLRHLLMLKGYTCTEIADMLRKRSLQSPALSAHPLLIPMLLEAARNS